MKEDATMENMMFAEALSGDYEEFLTAWKVDDICDKFASANGLEDPYTVYLFKMAEEGATVEELESFCKFADIARRVMAEE